MPLSALVSVGICRLNRPKNRPNRHKSPTQEARSPQKGGRDSFRFSRHLESVPDLRRPVGSVGHREVRAGDHIRPRGPPESEGESHTDGRLKNANIEENTGPAPYRQSPASRIRRGLGRCEPNYASGDRSTPADTGDCPLHLNLLPGPAEICVKYIVPKKDIEGTRSCTSPQSTLMTEASRPPLHLL